MNVCNRVNPKLWGALCGILLCCEPKRFKSWMIGKNQDENTECRSTVTTKYCKHHNEHLVRVAPWMQQCSLRHAGTSAEEADMCSETLFLGNHFHVTVTLSSTSSSSELSSSVSSRVSPSAAQTLWRMQRTPITSSLIQQLELHRPQKDDCMLPLAIRHGVSCNMLQLIKMQVEK